MSEKCPDFKWTIKKEKTALALANGFTQEEAAVQVGISSRTIRRWLNNAEFACEIDRLTHMVGIATRAERIRIAMRVVRGRMQHLTIPPSKRDLLEWLKYIQSETDGVKLDLTSLFEDALAMAGGGSAGADPEE